MEKTIFLFDLDSTVTTVEILPTIAKKINKSKEMSELTEKTMLGELDFRESFLSRVEILKDISVNEVAEMISEIPLGNELVKFLQENRNNCYIVTSNLDVWIEKLMKKIGMEDNFFSSIAIVENDKIKKVAKILTKDEIVKRFDARIIAVGDGSNDRDMLKEADISIGYGGVRQVSPVLLDVVDHVICDEKELCAFLSKFV